MKVVREGTSAVKETQVRLEFHIQLPTFCKLLLLLFHYLADSSDLGCENIYKCCGKDIRNPGCVKICKKCGAPWGTPAKNCFKKDHELEPIEIEV